MADIEDILKDHIKVEVKAESAKVVTSIHDSVLKKVMEEVTTLRPIQVITTDGKKHDSGGISHEMTEEVLNYLSVRIPLLLVGPAGSGKTHIAINCAKLLGLDFYSISVNEQTSKSDFLGYKDANGKLIKTNFRTAYENGGVFIIDEIDAGNPNILTVVNSALSNETCPFPDGMITRHKDFVAVCTANTFGEGESLQYIGRNILDAATKDRFASLYIDYSENLELALVPSFKNLLKELRAHFKSNNVLMVVSTRAGIRLENLFTAKGGKVSKNDIVNCMNLQQEVMRDGKVVRLVEKYATA